MSTAAPMDAKRDKPENMSVSSNGNWKYDAEKDAVIIQDNATYTITRPYTWGSNHTTIIIDSPHGATLNLTNVDIDARTLTDAEAKSLLIMQDEDGSDVWRPTEAYNKAMENKELEAKVKAEGRAGIEITSRVRARHHRQVGWRQERDYRPRLL